MPDPIWLSKGFVWIHRNAWHWFLLVLAWVQPTWILRVLQISDRRLICHIFLPICLMTVWLHLQCKFFKQTNIKNTFFPSMCSYLVTTWTIDIIVLSVFRNIKEVGLENEAGDKLELGTQLGKYKLRWDCLLSVHSPRVSLLSFLWSSRNVNIFHSQMASRNIADL